MPPGSSIKLESFYNHLYHGLETNIEFINDLMFSKNELNLIEIIRILSEKIRQLNYFKSYAFYTVESNIDFILSISSDDNIKNEIEQDVEKLIDNGTFSWVLNNNRQIIVTSHITEQPQLLISISSKRRIHGLFIANAHDNSEISGIMQEVIGLLISTAAQAVDNNELSTQLQNYNFELNDLTVQLHNYNFNLEDKIKSRTSELEIAKDKAEQSAKSKLEFLANMSHEIRTPMNGVLGMLELLKKSKLDKTQHHQLDVAYQSGQNMMVILNDILELSKIEAGKISIEYNEFNLIETIEDLLALFSTRTNENNVELISIINKSVPEIVYGAQTRIWQIIMNLLGNAVKFTSSGSIVLTADAKEIKSSDSNQTEFTLNINITDTGIGISDEALKLIFNPFEQAEINTSRKYGGTGLGLALCNRLTTLLGGEIKAESVLGEGSSFSFSLKLQPVKIIDSKSIVENTNILYIDSSEVNSRSIVNKLNRLSIPHTVVTSEQSAIDELNKKIKIPYSIILINNVFCEKCYSSIKFILNSTDIYKNTQYIILSSKENDFTNVFSKTIIKPCRTRDITSLLSNQESKSESLDLSTQQYIINARILLVEDNEVNQLVAKGMLDQLGVDTKIANDGLEAVHITQNNQFDLILMDINMPNMDGYEATKNIRDKENSGTRTPIIALTANVMTEDVKKYYKAGMDDFMAKPYSFENIESCLMKWINNVEQSIEVKTKKAANLSSTYIDSEKMNSLKLVMGDNLNDLINIFIERSSSIVDEITKNEEDLDKIKFNLHSLKGSSGNIGAMELFNLCDLIENHVCDKRMVNIDSYLNILKLELEGVHKELRLI